MLVCKAWLGDLVGLLGHTFRRTRLLAVLLLAVLIQRGEFAATGK
jgi:hypothetical protein